MGTGNEHPPAGASVILQGQFDETGAIVSEIIVPELEAPAPATTAAVAEKVRAPAVQPVSHRSGWLWQPQLWQQTPERLWATVASQALNRVYLTIPTQNGRIMGAKSGVVKITVSRADGVICGHTSWGAWPVK